MHLIGVEQSFRTKKESIILLKNGTQRSALIGLQYADGLEVITDTKNQLTYSVKNQKKKLKISLDSIEKVTLYNGVVFVPISVMNSTTYVPDLLLSRLAYHGKTSVFEYYEYRNGGLYPSGSEMHYNGNELYPSGSGTYYSSPNYSSKIYVLKEGEENAVRLKKKKTFKKYMQECKPFAKRFRGWTAKDIPPVSMLKYYLEHCGS